MDVKLRDKDGLRRHRAIKSNSPAATMTIPEPCFLITLPKGPS